MMAGGLCGSERYCCSCMACMAAPCVHVVCSCRSELTFRVRGTTRHSQHLAPNLAWETSDLALAHASGEVHTKNQGHALSEIKLKNLELPYEKLSKSVFFPLDLNFRKWCRFEAADFWCEFRKILLHINSFANQDFLAEVWRGGAGFLYRDLR